jgi:hypothetical protein
VKPTILIRIAAIVTLLLAIGHTLGRPWTPTHGVAENAVVASMHDVHFSALGSERSYWDFYQGFGIALSGLIAVQAVLLWQLAATARDGGRYKGPVVVHLVGFLFFGLVSAKYIFILPLWFALAIAVCLALSLAWRPMSAVPQVGASTARPSE